MKCSNPVLAVDLGVNKETGKKDIKIIPVGFRADYSIEYLERLYGKDRLLKLPCGKCIQCKEASKEDWAIRCDMESRMYAPGKCWFLTLTYRDECCPRWLSKGHLKKFLRHFWKFDRNIKVFACGEYGEKTNRPHYHVLIFGYDAFPDLYIVPGAKTKSGLPVYESKFIERVWNKGYVQVGEVNADAGLYVAGYVNKKTGVNDGFLYKSKCLGDSYMVKHFHELYESRYYLTERGRVFRVPRRFKSICEKLGYLYQERSEDKVRMRLLENSEMVSRKLRYREELFGYGENQMKDKLNKRLNRL